MTIKSEVVFSGHGNEVVVELSSDGVVVDLSPVTRVVVSSAAVMVDSDVTAGAIDWSLGNGQIKLMFGGLSLPVRLHSNARIITYDSSNPAGIVWTDDFQFEVR